MEVNEPAAQYARSISGISRADLNAFLGRIGMSLNEFSKMLPVTKRTIEKVPPAKLLNQIASDRILQIIALYRHGEEVFGSLEDFKEWLRTPVLSLGDRRPQEFLNSSTGISLVSDTLGRISFGVYA